MCRPQYNHVLFDSGTWWHSGKHLPNVSEQFHSVDEEPPTIDGGDLQIVKEQGAHQEGGSLLIRDSAIIAEAQRKVENEAITFNDDQLKERFNSALAGSHQTVHSMPSANIQSN